MSKHTSASGASQALLGPLVSSFDPLQQFEHSVPRFLLSIVLNACEPMLPTNGPLLVLAGAPSPPSPPHPQPSQAEPAPAAG
eukprot:scaffold148312_cov17-Tisochrysis_lutea.AAC.1